MRANAARRIAGRELSERETEVLRRMSYGMTNAQIAEELGMPYETVKHHVRAVLVKLGAHNRIQAVNRGREAGCIL